VGSVAVSVGAVVLEALVGLVDLEAMPVEDGVSSTGGAVAPPVTSLQKRAAAGSTSSVLYRPSAFNQTIKEPETPQRDGRDSEPTERRSRAAGLKNTSLAGVVGVSVIVDLADAGAIVQGAVSRALNAIVETFGGAGRQSAGHTLGSRDTGGCEKHGDVLHFERWSIYGYIFERVTSGGFVD
jgi:hypothetical protein